MPYRITFHAKDQLYHVFNRGVARMPIFTSSSSEFGRFIELIKYYQFANTPISFSHFKKLASEQREMIATSLQEKHELNVEIQTFCLMNNHYHFLLKQVADNGISKFISTLQNGYAKYYNLKKDRSGPLFQPMFKSVRIETDEQLLHVSRYIHLNPSTGYITTVKDLHKYPWSSLTCYTLDGSSPFSFVNTEMILGLIDREKYRKFVFDQAEYQRELGKIKHLLLE